ncbi:MAG: hypothetical protein ABJD11_12145 [Gemmatimonadota bacterium]
MTGNTAARPGNAWNAIEREREIDRMIRRICVVAWSITFAATACYALVVVLQAVQSYRLYRVRVLTGEAVWASVTPLILALGGLALLVAALSTVGVFLRFRTAALGEIQQRLEALEAMLSARNDAE